MRQAYVTVLSDDSYYKGVLALKNSLKTTKTKYPFVVVVTDSVSEAVIQQINECGGVIKRLKSFDIPDYILKRNQEINQNWNKTFDKLKVFDLIEYDKLVYLDCDMLILSNLDFLFNYPSFSAAWAGKSVPGDHEFGTFNSGCMVIEPTAGLSNKIFSLLAEVTELKPKGVGDQDLIQYYLTNWENQTEKHIPEGCGIFGNYLDYYVNELGYSIHRNASYDKDVKIIHFIGPDKPWKLSRYKLFRFIVNRLKHGHPLYAYWTMRYLAYMK